MTPVNSPEVVKNEPYGEKADIWALGCILYQMATLKPPFYSSNILSLASKIVEAEYEPVEEGAFSERVPQMIRWCLAPDAERRPDVIAVSSRISDVMMRLMDGLYTSHNALERRAERDRKRAQKCFIGKQASETVCCYSRQVKLHVETQTDDLFILSLYRMDFCAKPRPGTAPKSAENTETPPIKCLFFMMSVSAGICVSQKMLRQIHDPIQKLLVQLHKVIFITQLPPSPSTDIERRLVEKFKKSLFHLGSDPYNLKVELSKVQLFLFTWPLVYPSHTLTGAPWENKCPAKNKLESIKYQTIFLSKTKKKKYLGTNKSFALHFFYKVLEELFIDKNAKLLQR
uniref:Protein kinase domain-containing protein n=1 Tax=Oryzias sinensis TaxID=183150 RepID=A0A8C8DIN5_9TELE